MRIPGQLFVRNSLNELLAQRRQNVIDEINSFTPEYLLNIDIEDLYEALLETHRCALPALDEKAIAYTTEIPPQAPFTKTYKFEIPFSGDTEIVYYTPSRVPRSPINASLDTKRNMLLITVQRTYSGHNRRDHQEASEIEESIAKSLELIRQALSFAKTDIETYNLSLKGVIKNQLDFRRQQFQKDQNVLQLLPYHLKERTDIPTTIAAPIQRKLLPKPLITKEQSEFYLEMEHYEHVLKILNDMSKVMERSPRAFDKIPEEDLRWHFIFQLNGHFEGQATGETFNSSGKPDILIRVNNNNIFIGECKFWGGKKKLTETIDQILRYVTWRDTKAAVLLFVRQKSFSSVLEQIPNIVQGHQQFEAYLGVQGETQFRFKLTHQDDAKRVLSLAVLAFYVPKTTATE